MDIIQSSTYLGTWCFILPTSYLGSSYCISLLNSAQRKADPDGATRDLIPEVTVNQAELLGS
jgi:hypothetical protein